MKQILIATHGKMASGIRYTAELIVGKMPGITTIDAYVEPDDNIVEKFRAFFEAHKEERIIVFTDLMGGSVNQKLMEYAGNDNVTLITGTNLPVLMQVMLAEDDVSEEKIEGYIADAREELQLVSVGEKKQEAKPKSTEVPAAKEIFYENSGARIAALRVDDRLIHGQVAMTWTKQLKVNGIVVANDDAASDNTQKMALKMAVPAGIKVLIKPVQEAIRVLNDPRAEALLTDGTYELILADDAQIFAYFRKTEQETWLVAANLSEQTVPTDGLKACVKAEQEIVIANYPERKDLEAALRPYEAFMMRVRV